jgi:hypothetical protein
MVSTASGASDQGVWGLYRSVLSWRFQWDHRRPCPTSAAGDIADLVKSSFGGLRDLWSGSLRCLWMHLFKPVLMIPSAAMSDIGGRIYHRLFTAAAISARTYVITWDCSHWPLQVGGRGVMETCRLLTAAALSSRSYVIKIVFSLLMSPSLVCWIGPTAVRKKAARVPLGRGLIRARQQSHTSLEPWQHNSVKSFHCQTNHRTERKSNKKPVVCLLLNPSCTTFTMTACP